MSFCVVISKAIPSLGRLWRFGYGLVEESAQTEDRQSGEANMGMMGMLFTNSKNGSQWFLCSAFGKNGFMLQTKHRDDFCPQFEVARKSTGIPGVI